ncbi:GntR family transcriptional regulator [Streptomyces sp. HK10]|uniref:GntR family transcriptional regulator n=1 Tax=Streptomyces sp. HK10 TaxID=3373255 RepID=UPI003748D97D
MNSTNTKSPRDPGALCFPREGTWLQGRSTTRRPRSCFAASSARTPSRAPRPRKPPCRQLAGTIRARIERGDWKVNRPIASGSRLVDEFGLSRPTVRRAIALLVEQGFLFVVPQ